MRELRSQEIRLPSPNMVRPLDATKDPNLRDDIPTSSTTSLISLLTTPERGALALLQSNPNPLLNSSPSSPGLRCGLDIFHSHVFGVRPNSHTFRSQGASEYFHDSSRYWTPRSILLSGGSAQYLNLQPTTSTELEVDELIPSAKLDRDRIDASMAFSQAKAVPGTNA